MKRVEGVIAIVALMTVSGRSPRHQHLAEGATFVSAVTQSAASDLSYIRYTVQPTKKRCVIPEPRLPEFSIKYSANKLCWLYFVQRKAKFKQPFMVDHQF